LLPEKKRDVSATAKFVIDYKYRFGHFPREALVWQSLLNISERLKRERIKV
jgi:hypothetical protein